MKKYTIWIIEALIWLLAIISLIIGCFLYNHIKLKEKHSYHVFFNDTNGIRNGSPVKIMGNEIGYVSNVNVINNNEVFISFVVTEPNISIPAGTFANIESTGLVGSRSLELYPPTKETQKSEDLIIPQNPARVQGAFTNSVRVAEVLYSASSGVNKAVDFKKIPTIRNFIHQKSIEANNIDTQLEQINEYQTKTIKNIKDNQGLHEFNKKMENLAK